MLEIRTEKATVGDVIKSADFVHGHKSFEGDYIDVSTSFRNESFIVGTYKNGKRIEEDLSAHDLSRATARYVVEEAEGVGGGMTGYGPLDYYPNGWRVFARRLNEDGTFNPEGERIRFYQSSLYSPSILEVVVVGKMRRIFN